MNTIPFPDISVYLKENTESSVAQRQNKGSRHLARVLLDVYNNIPSDLIEFRQNYCEEADKLLNKRFANSAPELLPNRIWEQAEILMTNLFKPFDNERWVGKCCNVFSNKSPTTSCASFPPIISKIEWGKIVLESGNEFKDVMLAPSMAMEWDWSISGTNHTKGIQKSDIDLLIGNGATALVLSRGMDLKLNVSDETFNYAKDKVKTVIVDETRGVVKHYNRLVADGIKVGALIHSTC